MRPAALAPALALALAFELLASARAALAEAPLTAEAFEAHVEGRTITYSRLGSLFGIEEYLPGRQVRWSVAPELCQYGTWYPQGEDICFVYTDDPVPHCWTFWLQDGALRAEAADGEPGFELLETAATDQGLPCPGPDVGV